MMKSSNYLINSRPLTTYYPIESELQLDKQKNYLFNLANLGVLNLNGDKAVDFLQGQVTCDVNSVSDIQMRRGAQCNLKGRILALMDIINWQGMKLVIPNDLIDQTQNSLSKSAMLSRVSLEKNTGLKAYGFYLHDPKDILPLTSYFPSELFAFAYGAHYCYYHLGQGFYLFLIQNEIESEFCQSFIEKNQLLGSLSWHTLMLKNGYFDIYPESRGLFLPHRLGLHQTSTISFNKGCYKGQEIIARMHYKSTVKHELTIFHIKTDSKIFSGQKLMNLTKDIELGELVDYSYLGDNNYIVAVSLLKTAGLIVNFEGHSESVELKSNT